MQPYFHQCIKLTSSSIISHYDEDVNMMRESIESVLQRLPSRKSHRVIIYSKGDRNKAGLRELLEISDEVVAIPNVGREGETYLVSLFFSHTRVLTWNADRACRIIYADITTSPIRVWQVIPSSCRQVSIFLFFLFFFNPTANALLKIAAACRLALGLSPPP